MCEKLHVLPGEGGLFDQDEKTIHRLMVIYDHLEDWRKLELDKASKTPPSND